MYMCVCVCVCVCIAYDLIWNLHNTIMDFFYDSGFYAHFKIQYPHSLNTIISVFGFHRAYDFLCTVKEIDFIT